MIGGKVALLVIAAGPAARWTAVAQPGEPGPTSQQVSLLLKILTFDRALDRNEADLRIVVVEDPLDPISSAFADELSAELALYDGQRIGKRTLRAMRRSVRDLLAKDDSTVEVLYLAPGLAGEIPRVLAWSSRNDSFTFSGVPELEAKGIGVWLGVGDTSPKIRINLTQVRAEGRDLDARLLSLATVER
jgi:hypothetical protein